MNRIEVCELIAVVPSIVLHEVAHGFVADKCGDPTARAQGRLTLNPIAHIDPVGTVLMPLLLALTHLPVFGYAKPVPVNVNRLRKPRNQSVLVSLAGPGTNIILSGIAWIVTEFLVHNGQPLIVNEIFPTNLMLFFMLFGAINLILAVFNMIPIPPFDGSAVVERLVPRKHLRTYFELRARAFPVTLVIIFVLLWTTSIGKNFSGDLVSWWTNLLV